MLLLHSFTHFSNRAYFTNSFSYSRKETILLIHLLNLFINRVYFTNPFILFQKKKKKRFYSAVETMSYIHSSYSAIDSSLLTHPFILLQTHVLFKGRVYFTCSFILFNDRVYFNNPFIHPSPKHTSYSEVEPILLIQSSYSAVESISPIH